MSVPMPMPPTTNTIPDSDFLRDLKLNDPLAYEKLWMNDLWARKMALQQTMDMRQKEMEGWEETAKVTEGLRRRIEVMKAEAREKARAEAEAEASKTKSDAEAETLGSTQGTDQDDMPVPVGAGSGSRQSSSSSSVLATSSSTNQLENSKNPDIDIINSDININTTGSTNPNIPALARVANPSDLLPGRPA